MLPYVCGIITSLAKKIMFSVALVCLGVCKQHYSKMLQTDCDKILLRGLGW